MPTFANGATFSPRSLGMQTSYTANLAPAASAMAFSNLGTGIGNAFSVNATADIDGSIKAQNSAISSNAAATTQDPSSSTDRNVASTFGFHNWLLQPYEGGADGLGQFSTTTANSAFGQAAANAMLFANPASASPSAYAGVGVDPFQTIYATDPMSTQQTPSRLNGTTNFVAAHATERQPAAETDASTLLDFLSMLPATSPSSGASASNGKSSSMQSKA
uniref:Uncharacterized protein n=2 Tax=Kalmanozyma brasiliensis (strain GHG001) TaxID=1365824 RepID=V5GP86_KALBG